MVETTEAGPDVRREAEEAVRESIDRLRRETHDLAASAKRQAGSMFGRQKDGAADQLDGLAQALRRTSDDLQQQDLPQIAEFVGQAAGNLHAMAGALREKNLTALRQDFEDYARRHPAVVLGGAVLAGFCLARLLRNPGPSRASAPPAAGTARSSGTPGREGADPETPVVVSGTAGAYVPPHGGM